MDDFNEVNVASTGCRRVQEIWCSFNKITSI